MYLGAGCPFSHGSVCVSKGFLFSECDDKSARRAVVFSWLLENTSLAVPGALANRLQRRTARKANEANLNPQNQKFEITSL